MCFRFSFSLIILRSDLEYVSAGWVMLMNIIYCVCSFPQELLWPMGPFIWGKNGPLRMPF